MSLRTKLSALSRLGHTLVDVATDVASSSRSAPAPAESQVVLREVDTSTRAREVEHVGKLPPEVLTTTTEVAYDWDYSARRAELRTLYEKSKDLHVERAHRPRLVDERGPGERDRRRLVQPASSARTSGRSSIARRELPKLRRHMTSYILSNFLHGEQGALMATSQIVASVADDRLEALRRRAGVRRGAPRRGVRPLPAREGRADLPAEPAPEAAARHGAHRLALGLQVPRHADPGRGRRARRVRAHPPDGAGAAHQAHHAHDHAGRGAARRVRRDVAARALRRHEARASCAIARSSSSRARASCATGSSRRRCGRRSACRRRNARRRRGTA